MTIEQFDYARLATSYEILPFIYKQLSDVVSNKRDSSAQGLSEDDDIKLELVSLVGTMCLDDNCIPMMASCNLPKLLIDFMIGMSLCITKTFSQGGR